MTQEKTLQLGRFSFMPITYLAALSLLLMGWLLPSHFPPWVSWHMEVPVFLAAFLVAWAVVLRLITKKGSRSVCLPSFTLPFMVLALIAVGQFAVGHMTFGGDALIFTLYMTLCVICSTLGFACGGCAPAGVNAESAKKITSSLTMTASGLLLGAFASATIAFAQMFELWEHSPWINQMPVLRRPGANLGQPNHLATLLLMGTVSLLFLYESRKLKAAPSALIFLMLCIALAASESRTGVLSFLLLSVWWFVKYKRGGFRLSPWAVALASISFLGLFWAWPSIFAFVFQTTGVEADVNVRAGTRLLVWPQLLEALAQRPLWGWGLGEIPEAHNAVAHSYTVSEPFSYSHNILLDLALGVGVPLTATLILVTGVWLWRRVRTSNQLLPWYCLALALPVAVHSMLEFPFAYAYFLVPVMFVLGILEGMGEGKPVLRIGGRLAAVLLLGVSIVGVWSVVEYIAIEEDFRVVRFETLRLGQTPVDYQRPHVILLTQLDALLDGARITPKPNMTDQELALAKNVALRYPWTATQNRYALSLALNGSPEEAIRQLRVMKAMHGEKRYGAIKTYWNELARDKYPQLGELTLP